MSLFEIEEALSTGPEVPAPAPPPAVAEKPTATIHRGHALEVLRRLPDASVHCIITSPPYWGLRDYKSEPLVWGGNPACAHEFVFAGQMTTGRKDENQADIARRFEKYGTGRDKALTDGNAPTTTTTTICARCGAWRGALGLEPTPELFVEHLVTIFREARRVLRHDGVLFLNIGDSYNGAGRQGHGTRQGYKQDTNRASAAGEDKTRPNAPDLKPKDLVGIPWMLAFALRADGWYLRSDIIWAKGISFCESYSGSTMPESVTDRPTKGHEYVFLLTKSEDYFWDQEAIKERGSVPAGTRGAKASAARAAEAGVNSRPAEAVEYDGTRNVRSVWAIPEPHNLYRLRADLSEADRSYVLAELVKSGSSTSTDGTT